MTSRLCDISITPATDAELAEARKRFRRVDGELKLSSHIEGKVLLRVLQHAGFAGEQCDVDGIRQYGFFSRVYFSSISPSVFVQRMYDTDHQTIRIDLADHPDGIPDLCADRRHTPIQRMREGKPYTFCSNCGRKMRNRVSCKALFAAAVVSLLAALGVIALLAL